MEVGRLEKGVTKQLKFEIKEADTENCKVLPTGAVGMHSLEGKSETRPAFQECGTFMVRRAAGVNALITK